MWQEVTGPQSAASSGYAGRPINQLLRERDPDRFGGNGNLSRGRQLKMEAGPLTRLAFHPNSPAVLLNQRTTDRQPESGPFLGPFQLLEPVENLIHFVGGRIFQSVG